MVVKLSPRGTLVAALMLGVGLLVGTVAVAGDGYTGDTFCAICHQNDPNAKLNVYDDYMQHGHRWEEISTGGQQPGADLFGLANVQDAEGNPIALPDPTTVFVAKNLPDPNDGNKKKWALVDTNGVAFTGADTKFITAVASLSTAQAAAAKRMQWSDVRALLGNFKESAGGEFVTSAGQTVSAGGIFDQGGTIANMSLYTKRCFHCHNPTGFSSTPTAGDDRTMYGITAANWVNALKSGSTVLATFPIGAPALSDATGDRIQGVQCEHCHGAGGAHGSGQATDKTICVNCHSATDPTDPSADLAVLPNVDSTSKATWDTNKRIPFSPTADGKTGVFTNHHSQGDEFRRSPHKNITADDVGRDGTVTKNVPQGCVMCHDPHKSVWHDKGGVKYVGVSSDDPSFDEKVGNMCTGCHQNSDPRFASARKVRLRTSMADFLVCTDCHMPQKSEGTATAGVANSPTGGRMTHLFKINPTSLKASDNMSNELTTPWATTKANYWKSTDLNGDSFLTLDMVCTDCHNNMTMDQMAQYAQSIHRKPGLIDLTVNNDETLQFVQRADRVSVDFSVAAGKKAGKNATIYVLCQGPKGWQSWNGRTWKPGYVAWRKNVKLADIPVTNVQNGRLKPGFYNYVISIDLKDGSRNVDTVPVWVGR